MNQHELFESFLADIIPNDKLLYETVISGYNAIYLMESYKNLFQKDDMWKYASDVFKILEESYAKIGGLNIGSIDELIDESDMWKLYIKDGIVKLVFIYKDKNGRKLIAVGTDGSQEAKRILIKDIKHDLGRSYVEASGSLEKLINHIIGDDNKFKIPSSEMLSLTGKIPSNIDPDTYHYDRKIGEKTHTKALYGTPRLPIIKQ